MSMSRLACFALLFALFAPVARAGEPDWNEVRSPHFVVLTDAGASKGREVALRFEQMRLAFGALLLKDKVNISTPLLILAFRSNKELRQHVPLWKGKPVSLDGLYVGSSDRDFILLDLSSERAYEAVFHEYAHLLLNANLPPMPVWFDEGIAEYYSTLKVGKQFEFGFVPEYVPYVLRENGLMPVVQLFGVAHDSKTYNENSDHRSLFYAQSWLMIHYIVDTNKRDQAQEYCRLVLVDKVPVEEAIRRAFKMEPKQLDRELANFYRNNSIKAFTFPIPTEADSRTAATFAVRKVPALEAQTEIADLHIHSRDYLDRGVTELENILQQDPQNGRAHRSLGYAYLYRNELKKAGEQFHEAAQLIPNDARVHYYAAALVNAAGAMQGGDFTSAAMKDHLLKAVDLDPDYAEAWNLLGYVYRRDQKFPQAIDASLKAIKLAPRENSYRLNLAYVYLDARQYDDASAMLTYLKDSGDPAMVAQAEQVLSQLEERKQAPIRTGRFEERPRPATYDNPKWQKQPDEDKPAAPNGEAPEDSSGGPTPPVKIDPRPIRWLKGRLTAVTCEPSGAATLTVSAGKKTLQLTARDYKKMVLIGADAFSCSWANLPVAVNFRESSPTTGDLVSLELQ